MLLQLPRQIGIPTSWTAAADLVHNHPAMRDAVSYFRRVLGARWTGWQKHSHLARSFHTTFQGGEREWVRLHRLAIALDGVDNVELLVKDLGSPSWQKHVAAEQALEFCGRMQAAGRRVEIVQNTHEVSPDVRVWLHDRPVTIEFKALHDPDAMNAWDEYLDALHDALFKRRPGPDFFLFDIEFRDPALDHIEDVADTLAAIAVSGNRDVHELPHDAGLARYLADPGAMGDFRFPLEQQRDDLDRIVANLGSKYRRQLRAVDGPKLLAVLTKRMFFVPTTRIPIVARHVSSRLQHALAERTSIGGILLYEEPLEPASAPLLHIDAGWRFAMSTTERRARTSLLAQNSAAEVGLTEREVDVLLGEHAPW